jgi:hypothetical protein
MTKAQLLKRQKAVAAAIGSVHAEGLNPSLKTKRALKAFAAGKITATDLRKSTLDDIRTKRK